MNSCVLAIGWSEIGIGAAASLLTSAIVGLALWFYLPRGIALTKEHPVTNVATGEVMPDTWRLRNDSSEPIRVLGVYTQHAAEPAEAEMPVDGLPMANLTFDDHVLDTRRTDLQQGWHGQVIPPGESLTAHVGVMRHVRLQYRRDGPGGVFERRKITVFGYG